MDPSNTGNLIQPHTTRNITCQEYQIRLIAVSWQYRHVTKIRVSYSRIYLLGEVLKKEGAPIFRVEDKPSKKPA
jgi:hypothetical protein